MNFKTLLITSALSVFFNASAHGQPQTSVGDVVELETGELVYREFHTTSKSPDNEYMQTDYKNIDGRVIATRRVEFNGGYAQRYTFKQIKPNIEKTVARTAQEIKYIDVNGDKTTEKTFNLKTGQQAVLNAGMFNAVEREWASLLNGDTVVIHLVAPERERTFTMNLKKANIANSEMGKYQETKGKVLFKLTIANRFYRLLLKPIELGYDRETKRLVFYQGPSNIHKENGKKIGDIRVSYTND